MLLWMWLPCLCTNFSRQPQASTVATLRHCSPKGVNLARSKLSRSNMARPTCCPHQRGKIKLLHILTWQDQTSLHVDLAKSNLFTYRLGKIEFSWKSAHKHKAGVVSVLTVQNTGAIYTSKKWLSWAWAEDGMPHLHSASLGRSALEAEQSPISTLLIIPKA